MNFTTSPSVKSCITTWKHCKPIWMMWLRKYNERPYSGKYRYGKTSMQTSRDTKELAQSKIIDTTQELSDSASQKALTVR
ncbi:hypothetical protein [Nitrosomonas europaea]|uniref:hypothetical protein n=2 Tax=Nitrosomonas europaea TaxID=915 RepID=UPI0013565E08